jgi:hypothetical protein
VVMQLRREGRRSHGIPFLFVKKFGSGCGS